jgi:hypothetical protein
MFKNHNTPLGVATCQTCVQICRVMVDCVVSQRAAGLAARTLGRDRETLARDPGRLPLRR